VNVILVWIFQDLTGCLLLVIPWCDKIVSTQNCMILIITDYLYLRYSMVYLCAVLCAQKLTKWPA